MVIQIVCPRCGNTPDQRGFWQQLKRVVFHNKLCAFCRGRGFVWVVVKDFYYD